MLKSVESFLWQFMSLGEMSLALVPEAGGQCVIDGFV
jgi:hypothetical protein